MKEFPASFRCCARAIALALPLLTPGIAGAGGEPSPAAPASADKIADETDAMRSPVPYTAKYSVVTSGMTVAEAVYTLQRLEQGWEYRTHARPVKMAALFIDSEIRESSRIETIGGSVRPLQYRYEKTADKARDNEILQAHYDWQAGTVTVTAGDKTLQLAIDDATQDPLSAQLAMIQCLQNNCPEMDYLVLDETEHQRRRFERGAAESVPTPLGDYEAVRVSYHHGKRETITWLAPELNYIPVRIRQFRKGKLKSEMRITEVSFD